MQNILIAIASSSAQFVGERGVIEENAVVRVGMSLCRSCPSPVSTERLDIEVGAVSIVEMLVVEVRMVVAGESAIDCVVDDEGFETLVTKGIVVVVVVDTVVILTSGP